ncbi:MAG: glycoside hydrolase family 19 protein [Desulfuromonadaceae bacterium]
MNDENKTIGDLLKAIDDKTVDRAEVLPLLKGLERNTAGNTGKVIGTAITKAIATKQAGKTTDSTIPAAASAVATSVTIPSKKASSAVPSTTTPAATVRDASGKFHGKDTASETTPGASDPKNIGMTGALKNLFNKHKDGLKDTAGRMALGPLYDVAVEMKDSAKEAKERANDKTTVTGQLVKKTKGLFGFGKDKAQIAHDKAQAKHDKVEAASDKAEAKHDQLQAKADKAKQGAKSGTAAGSTVVNNNDSGGGLLDTASHLLPMLPKKVTGFLSKIPLLGKLFPATPALAGAGGGMFSGLMAKAGGLASKIPGAGMLGKIAGKAGGRIPLLGGLITAGTTLATGGSKSEAVGSGVGTTAGAMAGGALGSLLGPVGTVAGAALGGIAGDWIGTRLGGLFNNQNKADSDKFKQQQELLKAQDEQQKGFWDKLSSSSNPLLAGIGNLGNSVANGASAAGSAYSNSRAKGGGFFSSMVEGAKGAYQGVSGKTKERESMLSQAATSAGITDPKEKAAFMGQMNHESAGFTAMKEGNYSPDAVWKLRGGQLAKQGISKEQVSAAYASGGSGAMDEMMYGGRMGNTQKGDATKFKGRGFVQLTGKDNYADMTKRLQAEGENVDLLKNPEMAEDPRIAAKISTLFWKKSGAGAAARNGDQAGVDQAINGGAYGNANGKADRAAKTQYYASKLAKEGTSAAPLVPGTPEFAAKQAEMQAKFVADTQAAPVQMASATGTMSQKKKGGKGKKKEAAPVVAKEEPKTIKDVTLNDQTGTEIKTAVAEPASVVGTPERKAKKSSELRAEREAASVVSTVSASAPATAVQVATATQPLNATVPPAPAAATGTAQTSKKKTGFFDSLSDTATVFASGFAPNLAKSVSLSDTAATVAGKVQSPTTATATGAAVQAQPETVRLAKRSSHGVQTFSPLPQPQVAQAPLPPPVEVPGLERLAKSQEQQAVKKPDVVANTGIPHIKTEFDDTMLVLMSYDRI